ncbi:hypothetical protein EJ06DRAFT_30912 [Trichodelitschia bisporula]|uniref:Uncharacterized protein n=1 Tax=Trichodelitschia bisporula TaxID=703511 RepID=A0A6G1IB97_9PEZI|nr:hypothetical protein EJ06DRAFT_30912 [Trichodelitschia bisporula]
MPSDHWPRYSTAPAPPTRLTLVTLSSWPRPQTNHIGPSNLVPSNEHSQHRRASRPAAILVRMLGEHGEDLLALAAVLQAGCGAWVAQCTADWGQGLMAERAALGCDVPLLGG